VTAKRPVRKQSQPLSLTIMLSHPTTLFPIEIATSFRPIQTKMRWCAQPSRPLLRLTNTAGVSGSGQASLHTLFLIPNTEYQIPNTKYRIPTSYSPLFHQRLQRFRQLHRPAGIRRIPIRADLLRIGIGDWGSPNKHLHISTQTGLL